MAVNLTPAAGLIMGALFSWAARLAAQIQIASVKSRAIRVTREIIIFLSTPSNRSPKVEAYSTARCMRNQ
jgi:hypothetical protein